MDNLNIDAVIIDADEKSLQTCRSVLADIAGIRVVEEVTNLNKAFDVVKQAQPQLVVLNLHPSVDEALELSEKITQEFLDITVFVSSPQAKPETIIRAMHAGAREYLIQPVKKEELAKAAKFLLKKIRKVQGNGQVEGQIIAVFGAKGGVGATTIATNLGCALSLEKKKNVLLLDLNLKLGNVPLFLNMQPTFSLLDIANNINDIDYEMLKKSLPTHHSGVKVLAAPQRIEEAEAILASHIEQILSILKYQFDFIIMDVPPTFDDVSITAMDFADSIFAISTMELASIYDTKNCLELFDRMGYDSEKVKLVINRYPSSSNKAQKELEKTFEVSILQRIENDNFRQVNSSIHIGEPFSALGPESTLRLGTLELAASLNGHVNDEENEHTNGKTGILKKWIKR